MLRAPSAAGLVSMRLATAWAKKKRPTQIGVQYRIKICRRGVEHIQPLRGRNAGIGNQYRNRSQLPLNAIKHGGMARRRGNVAGEIADRYAVLFQLCHGGARGRIGLTDAGHRDGMAASRLAMAKPMPRRPPVINAVAA